MPFGRIHRNMNVYYENVKWIRGRAFYWNDNFVCSWFSTFLAPSINCRVNYMRTVRKWFPLASLIFASGQFQASNTIISIQKIRALFISSHLSICHLQIAPESDSCALKNITEIENSFFKVFFHFSIFSFLAYTPEFQTFKYQRKTKKKRKILSKATQFFRLINFPNTTLARWSVVKAISKPKPNPFTFVSNSLWVALYPYLVWISVIFSLSLARKTNFYRWDFSVKLSTFSCWNRLVKCLSRRWYMCAHSNERWKKGNSHWKSPSYLAQSTVFE